MSKSGYLNKKKRKKLKRKQLATFIASGILYTTMSYSPVYATNVVINSQAAFNAALSNPTTTQITFDTNRTITLTSSLVDTVASIGIDGNGGTLDGQNSTNTMLRTGGTFDITGLSNITLQNGTAYNQAGALHVTGNFTGGINNSIIQNNSSTLWNQGGGAIAVLRDFSGGINNSSFIGNQGTGNVGGAFGVVGLFNPGTGTRPGNFDGGINNSLFKDNSISRPSSLSPGLTTTHYGGAVGIRGHFSGGINNSTFLNNSASSLTQPANTTGYGGAVSVIGNFDGGIYSSTFKDNIAGNYGGALSVSGANGFTGDIVNSLFEGNKSGRQGGAIYVSSANGIDGKILDSSFINNSSGDGGAIIALYLRNGIENSLFDGNTAKGNGGAIAMAGGGEIQGDGLKNNTFKNNSTIGDATAQNKGLGGALFLKGDLTVDGGIFENNSASTDNTGDISSGRGGAIFHDSNKAADSFVVLKATDPSNPLAFYKNTHNIGNQGATSNSIYFGASTISTILPNATTNLTIDTASGTEVLMFDPMASQQDGIPSVYSQPYSLLSVNVEKTGAGNWLLSGHNDMKAASDWTISQGELHLIGNPLGGARAPVHIDLSHSNSSFTQKDGTNLALTLETSPHQITAETINLESNSTSSVRTGYQEPFVTWSTVTTTPIPVLELNATSLTNNQATDQTPGTLRVGVSDYDYKLYWGGINKDTLYLGIIPHATFNPKRAGVASLMGPGVINYYNPLPSEILRQAGHRFASSRSEENRNLWVTPLYSYINQRSSLNDINYDLRGANTSFGYDYWANERLFWGVVANIGIPKFNSTDAEIDTQDYTLMTYGGLALSEKVNMSFFAGFGTTEYSQTRYIHGEQYDTKYHGNNLRAGFSFGLPSVKSENFSSGNFLAYEYIRLHSNGYHETTGTYALTLNPFNQNIHKLTIGKSFQWEKRNGRDTSVQLYYTRLFGQTANKGVISFNSAPNIYHNITGDRLEKNVFGLSFKSVIPLSKKSSLEMRYQMEIGNNNFGHQAAFNFNIHF